MDAILNTPIQVLDKILALNLDINIWSARAKLTAEDFGERNFLLMNSLLSVLRRSATLKSSRSSISSRSVRSPY